MNKRFATTVATAILAFTSALAQTNLDNNAICSTYSSLCSEWFRKLEMALDLPPTNALEAIRTVACLRCTAAKDILLDNLDYPSLPQTSLGARSAKDFAAYFPFLGDYKITSKCFPVHRFLECIGVDFETLARKSGCYIIDEDTGFFIASLWVSCVGNFFYEYASKNSTSNDYLARAATHVIGLPSSQIRVTDENAAPGPFSMVLAGGANGNAFKKYEEMQKVLSRRFSMEKDGNIGILSSTIRTMGYIRSLKAVPLLAEHLTICPQASTNEPGGFVFPAAEALIEIGPAIGYCFGELERTMPLSLEESLWLRISHELYPEGLEYDLMRRAETNDTRAARLLEALPWRRLDENFKIIGLP